MFMTFHLYLCFYTIFNLFVLKVTGFNGFLEHYCRYT